MTHTFVARSPSDPNGKSGGLGFDTKEAANQHADRMNLLVDLYNVDTVIWNKDFWKTKPDHWFVEKLQ